MIVGDKVRCIDKTWEDQPWNAKVGSIYTVKDVETRCPDHIRLEGLSGWWRCPSPCFELVQPVETPRWYDREGLAAAIRSTIVNGGGAAADAAAEFFGIAGTDQVNVAEIAAIILKDGVDVKDRAKQIIELFGGHETPPPPETATITVRKELVEALRAANNGMGLSDTWVQEWLEDIDNQEETDVHSG